MNTALNAALRESAQTTTAIRISDLTDSDLTDLSAECEDHCAEPGEGERYWGTTEDGSEWTIVAVR